MKALLGVSFFVFLVASPLQAGEKSTPQGKKDTDPMTKAFEQLKKLTGKWEVVNGDKELPEKAYITYRLIGNGTTIIEDMFPGTKMEMISMYHRDGKDLVMTHYCAAGNQPRFKARIDGKTGDLIFDFAGGYNLDTTKDMHVHSGRIHFEGDNAITSEWDFWSNGKSGGSHKVKLKRIK